MLGRDFAQLFECALGVLDPGHHCEGRAVVHRRRGDEVDRAVKQRLAFTRVLRQSGDLDLLCLLPAGCAAGPIPIG